MSHRIPVSATLISVCSLLLPASASAADTFNPLQSGLKMLWALLVVLALIFCLYILAKRYLIPRQKRSQGTIRVLESSCMLPQKSLVLVNVKGNDFLVGTTSDGISTIVPVTPGRSFSEVLETSQEH